MHGSRGTGDVARRQCDVLALTSSVDTWYLKEETALLYLEFASGLLMEMLHAWFASGLLVHMPPVQWGPRLPIAQGGRDPAGPWPFSIIYLVDGVALSGEMSYCISLNNGDATCMVRIRPTHGDAACMVRIRPTHGDAISLVDGVAPSGEMSYCISLNNGDATCMVRIRPTHGDAACMVRIRPTHGDAISRRRGGDATGWPSLVKCPIVYL